MQRLAKILVTVIFLMEDMRRNFFTQIYRDLYGDAILVPRGGGALPYMGYIGMCRCERYGFQAVYSRIGYIN